MPTTLVGGESGRPTRGGQSRWVRDYANTAPEPRTDRRIRLNDVVREVSDLRFGATDCALPRVYALERGLAVDTFVVITDNEK